MARTMDIRSLYSHIYHTYICSCSCICIFLSMHLTDSLWLQVGGPGPHPCSSWPRSIPIPIALSFSRLCRVIYMVCVTSYLFGLAKRFVSLLWDSTISFCQLQAASAVCSSAASSSANWWAFCVNCYWIEFLLLSLYSFADRFKMHDQR